jgi:hypothetical protein
LTINKNDTLVNYTDSSINLNKNVSNNTSVIEKEFELLMIKYKELVETNNINKTLINNLNYKLKNIKNDDNQVKINRELKIEIHNLENELISINNEKSEWLI